MASADTDEGHHSAGASAFFAVAEEQIPAASGAEIIHEDIRGTKTRVEKLRTIGCAQVEADLFRRGLVARRHHVHPLKRIWLIAGAEFVEPLGGICKLGSERGRDFDADFITAATDGRAEGGEEIGGQRTEGHLHAADGFGDYALERAAPAGMNGGDSAIFRVNKQDGDTVGGLDAEQDTGLVRCGSVAAAGVVRRGLKDVN